MRSIKLYDFGISLVIVAFFLFGILWGKQISDYNKCVDHKVKIDHMAEDRAVKQCNDE